MSLRINIANDSFWCFIHAYNYTILDILLQIKKSKNTNKGNTHNPSPQGSQLWLEQQEPIH